MSARVFHPAQRTRRGDLRDRLDELVEPVPFAPLQPALIIPVGQAREVDFSEYLLELNRAAVCAQQAPR